MSDLRYVRDHISIDPAFAARLSTHSVGSGNQLVLVARNIVHQAGYVLALPGCHVTVIAQDYDGKGGGIDVSGRSGSPGSVGAAGTRGMPGEDGTAGHPGGPGTAALAAGSITLACENLHAGRFMAAGGTGGSGGAGGVGGDGGDGRRTIPRKVDGFPPGMGGVGGAGGAGGSGTPGGLLSIRYVSAAAAPTFANAGGPGGVGGPGGTGGHRGRLFSSGGRPGAVAASGAAGAVGAHGAAGQRLSGQVAVLQYWQLVNQLLGGTVSAWADARLAAGEQFYRRANLPVSSGPQNLTLATAEFDRVKRLRPGDALASRYAAQIDADQNILGLANRIDITPAFQEYSAAYTAWGPTVFGPFATSISLLLGGVAGGNWKAEITQHLSELDSSVIVAQGELDAARAGATAQQQALGDAQSRVDALTRQVNAAKAAMDDQSVDIGGIIGSVLAVATAVVAVIAAIPTAGTSLIALVPAFVALSSTIYNEGGAIVSTLLAGNGVPQDVKDAYAKAGKDIDAIVGAGKAIVNLVDAVNKLDAAKTTANAKYVELVKQALEAGHELLLAQHLMAQADLQVAASQTKVDQANALVAQAQDLVLRTTTSQKNLVDAAMVLIAAAESRRDTLLRFAFMAQRAVEIYTGDDESTAVRLDSGYVDPDVLADYAEGFVPLSGITGDYAAAWSRFMNPIQLESDYLEYFSGMSGHLDIDWQRLEITDPELLETFRTTHSLDFDVPLDSLPVGHFEAKVQSVAVSLVGATSPSGVSACELRHGPIYAQADPGGSVTTQILRPHTGTVQSPHTVLADSGVAILPGGDPLQEPLASPLWGRSVAGQWQLDLAASEESSQGTDLTGLSRIEVWLANEFYSPSA